MAGAFSVVELRASHTAERAFGCILEILCSRLGVPVNGIAAAEGIAIVLLAGAFWRGSRPGNIYWAGGSRNLLLLQGCAGTLVAPELLLLVSFQAGMVLPQSSSLFWVFVQTLFQTGAFYLQVMYTGDNPVLHLMGTDRAHMGLALAMVTAMSFVWHFLACSFGLMAASESRQSRELQRINAELRASRHMENDAARLAERLQLSRELHDSSGHHLAALSVNLRLMRHLEATTERNERLEESLLIVQKLLKDVREVVHDLRQMRTFDLRTALHAMTAGLPGLSVHLTLAGDAAQPPPFQSHALFRCCQEIVTNTLKHSRASNLWLEIEHAAHGYLLHARDDGQGTSHVTFGNGLTGIQERVSAAGGHMEVHSRPGKGFEIALELPVRDQEAFR